MISLLLATLATAAPAAAIDPCSLLDPKAIAAVQGAPPKNTKASEHPDGALISRQCFFTLPNFVQSVSFEVTTPNAGAKAKALRERWDQLSGKERERGEQDGERGKRARGGEEEEAGRPPRPVHGVGRAAVWVGSARAGALYVLAPAAILRVSVGGAADESAKIKSCSALAKNALQRLARLTKRG